MQSNQRMLYEKTRIIMWMTALHSGQLTPMSATRRAQFSQNLAWLHGTKAKPLIGANKLHITVVVGLQQLALLEPVRQYPVRHFPIRHCPVLQCPVLQIQLSHSHQQQPSVTQDRKATALLTY